MLGIADGWVAAAYILCLASAALCVVYGLINWNRGDETTTDDDKRWVKDEEKLEEEL